MSWRLRAISAIGRAVTKRAIRKADDPAALRALFEWAAPRSFPLAPYTLLQAVSFGGRDCLRVRTRPGTFPARPGLIFYVHGGAFIAGSPRTHAGLLSRLARMTRIEVIAPSYRLAPEHPFPAGPDDIRAAFDGIVAAGYPPETIVIGGDSAGGNLVLGLLAGLLDDGIRPAGAFAISPTTDLGFSGPSIEENSEADSVLPADRRGKVAELYLQGASPVAPRSSPLYANWHNPPPVFLQVAETEILRDDSLRLAERLRAAGGEVEVDLLADAPHVVALFEAWLPEARAALGRIADFVIARLDPSAQATAADKASR